MFSPETSPGSVFKLTQLNFFLFTLLAPKTITELFAKIICVTFCSSRRRLRSPRAKGAEKNMNNE